MEEGQGDARVRHGGGDGIARVRGLASKSHAALSLCLGGRALLYLAAPVRAVHRRARGWTADVAAFMGRHLACGRTSEA